MAASKRFLSPYRAELFLGPDEESRASISIRRDVGSVVLLYGHRGRGEEWRREEYPVFVEWTRCNYGGLRPWFHCPVRTCDRRVAVLYGSGMFACRQCHQLAYERQRETSHSRALSRAQAIREKLGGSPCVDDDFPPKPKGMHWRTYRRLALEGERAAARSLPPWMWRLISTMGASCNAT